MDPIFKWTGGKRKEIKIFSEYYPEFVKNKEDYHFIEPFVGGGAVFFDLENTKNTINDFDSEMISFYNMVKEQNVEFVKYLTDFYTNFSKLKESTKEERGISYYEWRKKKPSLLSEPEKAARFYIINQLAFNGMRRFNSKGEFNIPYGNYKTINIDRVFENKCVDLLKNTTIVNGTYKDVMIDEDNTFIFLDPPYTREFKTYSAGNTFDVKEQEELADIFKSLTKSKAMIIIDKSELTEKLYKDYIKVEYDLKYGTNIKNRFDNTAIHLLITNY